MPEITALQAQNKVCQDLDDLTLEYITLVSEHLSAWTRISSRFQEGREMISQAKYIMGPKNVSADCYDHRMKALRGVSIKEPATGIEIRDLRAEELERQRIQAAQEAAAAASEKNQGDQKTSQDQDQSRSGLRRRGGGGGRGSDGSEDSVPKGGDDDDEKADRRKRDASSSSSSLVAGEGIATIDSTSAGTADAIDETNKKPKKKERNPDPLLWFGVFVPASLRTAQTVFQQGLQDVVEMAMIRQKLIELEGRMMVLREAKKAGIKQLEIDLTGMNLE
ncbi:hypothetical protein BGX29_002928 [Mortierella sp. GBA35]|nr:hypothetical protein BGX29_002928 [Mortierella sp. GBA35]